uniref:Auxin-responsive protein n=1 Tax=Malus domestica TaxID=3750 RepID=A0A678XKC2_MALDO|nr:Auxin responsive protein [Malus domestica]
MATEMEGCTRKEKEACPQLLDLIPRERDWLVSRYIERSSGHGSSSSEEKKLELRLGPPGQDWSMKRERDEKSQSLVSLGYFSSPMSSNQTQKFISSYQQQAKVASFLHLPVTPNKASQPWCTKAVDLQNAENKGFSPAPANTAVLPNTSQKRKNLASNKGSSKPAVESENVVQIKDPNGKSVETSGKGLFVKINMDGVPIGRKVDLGAYDSYQKLSSAVDELFRGLLAAQRESCNGGTKNKQEEEKEITGLLDGSGEYTLVYEDNEGDRMLVGDVPWHMFVSTVKRLRVLKSSELSALRLRSSKDKMAL